MSQFVDQIVTIWNSIKTFTNWIQVTMQNIAGDFIPGYILGMILLVLLACLIILVIKIVGAVFNAIKGLILGG